MVLLRDEKMLSMVGLTTAEDRKVRLLSPDTHCTHMIYFRIRLPHLGSSYGGGAPDGGQAVQIAFDRRHA
jgi:hypothetical protein